MVRSVVHTRKISTVSLAIHRQTTQIEQKDSSASYKFPFYHIMSWFLVVDFCVILSISIVTSSRYWKRKLEFILTRSSHYYFTCILPLLHYKCKLTCIFIPQIAQTLIQSWHPCSFETVASVVRGRSNICIYLSYRAFCFISSVPLFTWGYGLRMSNPSRNGSNGTKADSIQITCFGIKNSNKKRKS